MSDKLGRNDPCPCGSGAKYKKCCAGKDAAAESEQLAQNKARLDAQEAEHRAQVQQFAEFHRAKMAGLLDDDDTLTEESNAVIDLIEAGQIEQAERAARLLLKRYPEVHDGFDRMGMVCEARRQWVQAAQWYRQCLEFVQAHRDQYEPAVEERYEQLIAKMEAADAAPSAPAA
jgi:tetratricopeptide (TPR) repeat protein